VIEHRVRDGAIERSVREWQSSHVSTEGCHPRPLGEFDHSLRGVDRDDHPLDIGLRPRAETTEPRANLEEAARPRLQDPGANYLFIVRTLDQLSMREHTLS
jgi:hypothetical protein